MAVNVHVAPKYSTMRRFATAKNRNELAVYFEYSNAGVEVEEDGLKEISFGEYLVDHRVLTRYQLFRSLQLQDRLPGVRLGQCAAALNYVPLAEIERLYAQFAEVGEVIIG